MRKIICLLFVFACLIPTAKAYSPTDASSVVLSLGSGWQITKTQKEEGIADITFYEKNANTPAPEELIETVAVKPPNSTDGFIKGLYSSVRDTLSSHNCQIEDINTALTDATAPDKYGFFWQCGDNQARGFMMFVDGDTKTGYSFAYKILGSYPITPANRDDMITILKTIQICYKENKCYLAY